MDYVPSRHVLTVNSITISFSLSSPSSHIFLILLLTLLLLTHVHCLVGTLPYRRTTYPTYIVSLVKPVKENPAAIYLQLRLSYWTRFQNSDCPAPCSCAVLAALLVVASSSSLPENHAQVKNAQYWVGDNNESSPTTVQVVSQLREPHGTYLTTRSSSDDPTTEGSVYSIPCKDPLDSSGDGRSMYLQYFETGRYWIPLSALFFTVFVPFHPFHPSARN